MTLTEAEKRRLAQAVVVQVRDVVPRYKDIDRDAQVRNTEAVLGCVGDLLVHRRTNRLSDFVESVAPLRAASGFTASDFLVGSMCFLPVLRRFLVHRADSTAEGLVMFELIEQTVLPFIGRVAEIYMDCSSDPTNPDGLDGVRCLSLLSDSFESTAPRLPQVRTASVEDSPELDDEFEDTAPGFG